MLLRLLSLPLFFVSALAFAQNPTPRPSPIPGGMMMGVVGSLMGGIPPETRCSPESIRTRAQTIIHNIEYGDVETSVNGLQTYMENCNLRPEKFGWGRGTFDYWKQQGYKVKLATVEDRIKRQSLVGKVSTKDLEDYKNFAALSGQSDMTISGFLKEQGDIAAKNQTPCEPKDMRKKFGEVRNQDGIGWCYAFAGADLLSYKVGERVSAADIALTYNDGLIKDLGMTFGNNEVQYDGSKDLHTPLIKMKDKGYCLEENLPSEDSGVSNLKLTLESVSKTKKDFSSDKKVCGEEFNSAQRLFPNLNPADYYNILEKSSRADFSKELQSLTCKNRKPFPKVEVVVGEGSDPKVHVDTIDQQLNQDVPVEIWYNADVALDPHFDIKLQPAGHASIVVGRRFNPETKSCEFLIRNSWGRSCGSYRPGITCEEGNYWIPKEDLMKGLYGTTYLK